MNAALADNSRDHYLYPGDLVVSAEATRVSTVLGSCVAVCLWDSVRSVGGVNHYLLPRSDQTKQLSARYGDPAIAMLLDSMLRAGARREAVVAKVFGGSQLIGAPLVGSIGDGNVAIAFEMLAALSIPVVAQDTGGTRARRLVFMTTDGTALVRRL